MNSAKIGYFFLNVKQIKIKTIIFKNDTLNLFQTRRKPNALLPSSFHQNSMISKPPHWRQPKRSTSERKAQPEQVLQINGENQAPLIAHNASVAITFKSTRIGRTVMTLKKEILLHDPGCRVDSSDASLITSNT